MVQTSPTPTPFDVGRAFVHQYYTLLHQAPHLLHRFYSNDSTFIHGGVDRPGCVEQPAVGPENISQRINDLNLRDCHAKIRQVDSHPTIGNGVVVQVTGELSNNGDPMRRFMQTFVLAPRQPKKYYVQNDIFRYQDEVFDEGSDEVDEDDQSSSHIYGDAISNADKTSNADSSAATGVMGSQQPLLVTATTRPGPPDSQQPLPPRSNGPVMPNNHNQVISNQVSRVQDHQHSDSNSMNGFSSGSVNDTTNYGGLGHGHIQTTQESNPPHTQPSPRPNNHSVGQDNQVQSNGTNAINQQQTQQQSSKQTGQIQQTAGSASETTRAEGTSYAGIAKLNSTTTSVPVPNVTGTTVSTSNTRTPTTSTGAPTNTVPQPVISTRPPVKTTGVSNGRPSNNPQTGTANTSQGRGGNNNYYSQNNRANVITAPNENQVFVGSLPPDFTTETLKQFFSTFGNVLDAKIHHANGDNKKNFGFVVFDSPDAATNLVAMAHINYNDTIRLNIEAKTPRNNSSNNNSGGNYSNGPQGGGRPGGYPPRGGGRGGNRGSYRGGSNNPRRGGGQYNNNSISFTASDEINHEYRSSKAQQQQLQ